jgi:hypothetical protein
MYNVYDSMFLLFTAQFQSQHCEQNSTHKNIHHTMLKPVVMYGFETWRMTDKDKYAGEANFKEGVGQ